MNEDRVAPPGRSEATARIPLEELPSHWTALLTVLDEDGVIRYESPSVERLYGFDQSELVGSPVADYVHPADRERVLGAFETLVASDGGTGEVEEYRHRRADDSYLWVESVASSEPTAGGDYVVNTRDVSAQKERERELERTNARLAEYASLVSHDLRNPLAVASGHLELAAAESPSDHLRTAEAALERMDSLIGDLLSDARDDGQSPAIERLRLSEVVEEAWRLSATRTSTLVFEDEATLRADRGRLLQLLENLYRNAVVHGGDGVTVSVGTTESGFFVADDGDGIPAADRERIFDVGVSTSEDGTGFGLAIVRDVIDAHDWELHVTDSATGGARFDIGGVDGLEPVGD